jgi:hypothetical protein
MCERGYRLLLWLFPTSFRRAYGDAALELVSQRWRDEVGLFRKFRLCFDLVIDFCVSVPKLYWEAQDAELQHATHAEAAFVVLYGNRVRVRALLVGALLSVPLFALVAGLPFSGRMVKPVLFAWAVCRLARRLIQFSRPIVKERV